MEQDVTAEQCQCRQQQPAHTRSSWAGCPRSALGEAGLDVPQLPRCTHRAWGRWEPFPAAVAAFWRMFLAAWPTVGSAVTAELLWEQPWEGCAEQAPRVLFGQQSKQGCPGS